MSVVEKVIIISSTYYFLCFIFKFILEVGALWETAIINIVRRGHGTAREGKHETGVFMGKNKNGPQMQLIELNSWRDAQTAHAGRKKVPDKNTINPVDR